MKHSIQSQEANKEEDLQLFHFVSGKVRLRRELSYPGRRMGRTINAKALNRKNIQIREMVI